jgi:hypothetical protein
MPTTYLPADLLLLREVSRVSSMRAGMQPSLRVTLMAGTTFEEIRSYMEMQPLAVTFAQAEA